jgi:hypothetical protein
MPSFSFPGLNGEKFSIAVPNGTTEAQARELFSKELNTGKLNNINIGQSLSALPAGAAGALNAVKGLTSTVSNSVTNAASVLKMPTASISVGSLNPGSMTGLLSQAEQLAKQTTAGAAGALPAVSAGIGAATTGLSPGIGKFGLTPQQMEDQGLLKPGTVKQFLGNNPTPAQIDSILKSPTIWTGKGGVTGLDSFTKNTNIQSLTQQGVMSSGLDQLKKLGVATGKESPAQLSALVQSTAKFGAADVAAWSKGLAPAGIAAAIVGIAKGAQFAVDIAGKLPKVSAVDPAGAVGTVNRAGVDNAIKAATDDPKIPAVTYGPVERAPVDPPTAGETELTKFSKVAQDYYDWLGPISEKLRALGADVQLAESNPNITAAEVAALDARYAVLRDEFNPNSKAKLQVVIDAYEALSPRGKQAAKSLESAIARFLRATTSLGKVVREAIAKLKVGTSELGTSGV